MCRPPLPLRARGVNCNRRKIVWLDECKVEFSTTAQPGWKVRIRAGEELLAANLAPSFHSNQTTI